MIIQAQGTRCSLVGVRGGVWSPMLTVTAGLCIYGSNLRNAESCKQAAGSGMNLLEVIREESELAETRQEPSPGAKRQLCDSGKKKKKRKEKRLHH